MLTKTFIVGGMHCAACSARVEKTILRLQGVESAAVNLAAEKAAVTFDPRILRFSSIKEAVKNAGYQPLEIFTDNADADKLRKEKEIMTLKIKFIIAAAFGLPLLYLAMSPMLPFKLPFPKAFMPMQFPLRYAIIQIALVIPIIVSGYKFYTVGFANLLRRSPNMDSLIAVGTTAAVGYSFFNVVRIILGNHMAVESLYFETAGIIITLILLGKTLEAVSKGRTGDAIKKLIGLAVKTAIIIDNGTEKEISIDEVIQGDIIVVKPGAKIPVDGTVTEGRSAVDESMLSGESIPVDKKPGDPVYNGAINSNGVMRIRAEKVGSETVLAQIIKLVEDAQNSKAPIARLADIVSGYFVPIVCLIAVLAGAAWFVAASSGIAVLPQGKTAVEFSLVVFISVLVIACPCALGLATPAAVMVGTGKGAENGILIKSGAALETAGKIQTIVFDKTGTITEGKPEVTDLITVSGIDENHLLQITASAEKGSEHPLGRAVVNEAEKRGLSLFSAAGFKAAAGLGIEAVVNGVSILAGNKKFMEERGIFSVELETESDKLAEDGKTPVYVVFDGKPAGIIAVADVIKRNSKEAVSLIHSMGIETVMITGDNYKAAAAVAKLAGIDRVLAEVLPQDKSAEIKKFQENPTGNKTTHRRFTAMVGDGINDAPALAQADVGIAVGSGTDIAIESADIVLMRSDLIDVVTAVKLSRKTIRTIKQNLFWAFGYNVLGIPVAAGFLYLFGGPLLNPMFAAAAMSLSSVSVLTNALRLKRFKAENINNTH